MSGIDGVQELSQLDVGGVTLPSWSKGHIFIPCVFSITQRTDGESPFEPEGQRFRSPRSGIRLASPAVAASSELAFRGLPSSGWNCVGMNSFWAVPDRLVSSVRKKSLAVIGIFALYATAI